MEKTSSMIDKDLDLDLIAKIPTNLKDLKDLNQVLVISNL